MLIDTDIIIGYIRGNKEAYSTECASTVTFPCS